MSKNQSDTVAELAAALAKAQGEIRHANTDCINPHFNSRYASLASIWDACRAALAANHLAVVHATDRDAQGQLILETKLIHASGEWVVGYYPILPTQATPQSFGSALTYARRYTLAGMVGIAPDEDDDANAAMPKNHFDKPQDKQQAKGRAAPADKRAAPKQQAPATAQGDIEAGKAIADIRDRIAKATTQEHLNEISEMVKRCAPAVRNQVKAAGQAKRREIEARLGKVDGGQSKTERLLQSEQEDDT